MKTAILALALLMAYPALAMTIDDLSPGKTVHGPALADKELKGKVVYVEFWGTR
jgi:hypothetical protein